MSKNKVKLDIDWGLIFFIACPEFFAFLFIFALAIKYWWVTLIAGTIGVICYFVLRKKKAKSKPKVRLANEIILDCKNSIPNVENLEFNTYLNSLNGLVLKTDNGDSSYSTIKFDISGFSHSHNYFNLEFLKSFRVYEYNGSIASWKGLVFIEIVLNKPWEFVEGKEEIRFAKNYQENAIKLYKILQTSSILRDKYLKQREIEKEKFAKQESHKLTETLASIKLFTIERNNVEAIRNKIEDFPNIKIFNVTANFKKSEMIAYVVLQIRTTNESVSQNGKITEIAALKYIEGKPCEKFIAKISTIKQTNTYTIDEIRQPLLDFIGNCNLISYDIKYCLKFLFVYGFEKLFTKKRKYFSVFSYLDLEHDKNFDLYSTSRFRGIFYEKEDLLASCFAIDRLFEKAIEDLEWKEFEKEERY